MMDSDNDDLFQFSDEHHTPPDEVEKKAEQPASEFEFAQEDTHVTQQDQLPAEAPWKILVVDDEEEIHAITRMVFSDYSFENRDLLIHSAYSAAEAIEVLKVEDDIALILLDVVMETDDAGLNCVKQIRGELNNHMVRIILRTGQPGQAPEQEVIVNYDINDYKAKTELTAQKLYTVVTASLRSYSHLKMINHNKLGLEQIIAASGSIFEVKSFRHFATGILAQLTTILRLDNNSLYVNISSLSAINDDSDQKYHILAATGDFESKIDKPLEEIIPRSVHDRLAQVARKHESVFTENSYAAYFETKKGEHNVLYLQWTRTISQIDRDLISIFATNVAIAFENISLNNEVIETQKEVIFTLAEVVEGHSKETANHIRRVAAVSSMLAKALGLNEHQIEMVRLASPMHDIGKVTTPDSILKKPGKLTADEYEIMKDHALAGYNIFKQSSRELMSIAGIIAHEHHEKWNGRGYPRGLKGDEIHIYGRITALADVTDALANKRCYKDVWPLEKIISLLHEERGEHFDPQLVDLFLEEIETFKQIQREYPS